MVHVVHMFCSHYPNIRTSSTTMRIHHSLAKQFCRSPVTQKMPTVPFSRSLAMQCANDRKEKQTCTCTCTCLGSGELPEERARPQSCVRCLVSGAGELYWRRERDQNGPKRLTVWTGFWLSCVGARALSRKSASQATASPQRVII